MKSSEHFSAARTSDRLGISFTEVITLELTGPNFYSESEIVVMLQPHEFRVGGVVVGHSFLFQGGQFAPSNSNMS
jgi:hypothetical protein